MMMRYLIIVICCLMCSCSRLGSSSVMFNQPTRKMQRIAVLIAQDEVFSNSQSDGEYLLFTKTLAEELARRKLFHFKIINRRYTNQTFDHLEASLTATELMDQYDGYLFCIPSRAGADYRVVLRLYQTDPHLHVMSVKHSTFMGNSYMFPQPSSVLLVDATYGALEMLENKLEKIEAR